MPHHPLVQDSLKFFEDLGLWCAGDFVLDYLILGVLTRQIALLDRRCSPNQSPGFPEYLVTYEVDARPGLFARDGRVSIGCVWLHFDVRGILVVFLRTQTWHKPPSFQVEAL